MVKVKNLFPWRFSSLIIVQSNYLVANPKTVSITGMHFKAKELLFVFVSLEYIDDQSKIIIFKKLLVAKFRRARQKYI